MLLYQYQSMTYEGVNDTDSHIHSDSSSNTDDIANSNRYSYTDTYNL